MLAQFDSFLIAFSQDCSVNYARRFLATIWALDTRDQNSRFWFSPPSLAENPMRSGASHAVTDCMKGAHKHKCEVLQALKLNIFGGAICLFGER